MYVNDISKHRIYSVFVLCAVFVPQSVRSLVDTIRVSFAKHFSYNTGHVFKNHNGFLYT